MNNILTSSAWVAAISKTVSTQLCVFKKTPQRNSSNVADFLNTLLLLIIARSVHLLPFTKRTSCIILSATASTANRVDFGEAESGCASKTGSAD
jgi:hypothetical protein